MIILDIHVADTSSQSRAKANLGGS